MTLIKEKLETKHITAKKIKTVMPDEVLAQIKHLCKEIAAVEWSGILFYKVDGDITNPDEMVITMKDIYLMHKGTQSYTEYEFGIDVIEHMENNPELQDCLLGHIHSHNNMSVFFSGTDMSELEDNSPNHNFYFSFIVNNRMEFCGKVAFMVEGTETLVTKLTSRDKSGKIYDYENIDVTVDKKMMVHYDCEVVTPEVSVSPSFQERTKEIIEKAHKATLASFARPIIGQGNTWSRGKSTFAEVEETPAGYRVKKLKGVTQKETTEPRGGRIETTSASGTVTVSYPDDYDNFEGTEYYGEWGVPTTPIIDTKPDIITDAGTNSSVGKSIILIKDAKDAIVADMYTNTVTWDLGIFSFLMYLCNMGTDASSFEDVEDILIDLAKGGISTDTMCTYIEENYDRSYNVFFQYFLKMHDTDPEVKIEHYFTILEDSIGYFEELRLTSKVPLVCICAERIGFRLESFKKRMQITKNFK